VSRTLLGVWAHPDDEAYLSAGLMAEHRRRGDRVVVVTATLGERGTADPATWPPDRLAQLRHSELRNALAAVGVDEIRLLGLPDGGCAEHDATDLIAAHIVDVDPDLIVTFGPDGMTGHPDHRAVSDWTTRAWVETRPGADLWYATLDTDFHDRWGAFNHGIGLWADQPNPPCTADADLARRLVLGDDLVDAKFNALQAHRSQTTGMIDSVGVATFREWWRVECFVRAETILTQFASSGTVSR
jgi:LmbE family N-acetylglucosaminyl deacetylase